MAGRTKQFKIGESVVGGIIQVMVNGQIIRVNFKDYNTKEDVVTGSVLATDNNARGKLVKYLEDNGTPYYADKVVKWIESVVDLNTTSRW